MSSGCRSVKLGARPSKASIRGSPGPESCDRGLDLRASEARILGHFGFDFRSSRAHDSAHAGSRSGHRSDVPRPPRDHPAPRCRCSRGIEAQGIELASHQKPSRRAHFGAIEASRTRDRSFMDRGSSFPSLNLFARSLSRSNFNPELTHPEADDAPSCRRGPRVAGDLTERFGSSGRRLQRSSRYWCRSRLLRAI